MTDTTFLSRERTEALAKRALGFSRADETRVSIESGWRGNTRFADGEITTGGGTTDTELTVVSTVGRRRAAASTNVLTDESIRRTVELAERLARLAPEDPELMPELGPQQYAAVQAFAQRTAELSPEARALAVERAMTAVREAGRAAGVPDLFVAGYLEAEAGVSQAVATSKGLFAYHPSTSVDFSITVRTPDGTGSGYASTGARDWSAIDAAALGRRAAEKALRSRNPVAIEPGQYTVILEPQAVADVLPLLRGALNARPNDEGRGTFSKKEGGTRLGEKIADERVTIVSDPADPELPGQPFDDDGLPIGKTTWIENGVLRSLAYSRFWAQRQKVQPNPGGGALRMAGGTKTTEELVASTERGILVTRFWYIRFLDQRTVMVTGLTRDGTFLVENGKVTKPLKNFRWNDSPLFMLNRIEELGRAERVSTGVMVPALKVRDWQFTSLSDAV